MTEGKILYNVTVKIDRESHEDWLNWMKSTHIPDVLNTGLFESHKMSRILGVDEREGITYAIQYVCRNMEDFEQYHNEFASKLQNDHATKFKDKYVAFRTIMNIVDESHHQKIE